jgi:hypothetical protein
MTRGLWLWAYIGLGVAALTLAVAVIARSCPVYQEGYLTTGCDDVGLATSWVSHVAAFVVLATVVTLIGTLATLWRRRQPTLASFVVWVSAGLLEVVIVAS